MHGSIGDRLEDLLGAGPLVIQDEEVSTHLSACADCSSELQQMRVQAETLRALRAPDELEPDPGFYARVIQRIEEQRKDSIWAVFLLSPFSRRLAYVSLTLALVFGSYVVAHEEKDGHMGGDRMVAQITHDDDLVFGNQAQQRDAVLANFASQ